MKDFLKLILKKLEIYHPLQSFYRNRINNIEKIFYRVQYYKYKGRGYTCNFCQAKYEKFIPNYPSAQNAEAIHKNEVVAGYGENVFCPNCLSKNRHRLVLAVLQNLLDVKGKKILQFAPEKNIFDYLKKIASVTTADLMPGFYKTIDANIHYADATQLPFENNSFDILIANHILEHIPNDLMAMREFHRILDSDGFAILQVPYSEKLKNTIETPDINDPAKQKLLYGQKDHVRIYSLTDYLYRLQSAGFTTKVFNAVFLKQFEQYAIQKEECFILAYKMPQT